jgi:hypothetical protein
MVGFKLFLTGTRAFKREFGVEIFCKVTKVERNGKIIFDDMFYLNYK